MEFYGSLSSTKRRECLTNVNLPARVICRKMQENLEEGCLLAWFLSVEADYVIVETDIAKTVFYKNDFKSFSRFYHKYKNT